MKKSVFLLKDKLQNKSKCELKEIFAQDKKIYIVYVLNIFNLTI